ncbi:MFS general substrate transporter [Aspergillus campestris IBT 28561]|uniref:MFS general substrate transporter n=1 Tax=Aspergillus campestris (strain IBT 28561) TaxID=1392248 RepID=A0A2I1CUT1_ASPC2|nr:MFS general substrate transporter [Aspergillus campestris IBT 28561]PKY01364.1 MFS general substrate transporter [Aspergillus campestris IBT 28561]
MRSSAGERESEVEKAPSSEMTSTTEANESTTMASEKATDEPDMVDWDGDDDPHNPQNWSLTRKWCLVGLVSAVTFNISMASTVTAPAVPLIMAGFNQTNAELQSFVVSIYILGFAFGPLVVAPLSELYGRSPILHVTNIVFLIFNIACAVSTNLAMFTVFRLIVGLMACTPVTLGGGFIYDLMPAEHRARALMIWTMGPLMRDLTDNGIGPVVGGYLAEGAGWQWVFWLVTILSAILTTACFIFVRETYAPVLLTRKAATLRKQTDNPALRSKYDSQTSTLDTFLRAIVRPTKMLLFAPIVTLLALYIAMNYTYLYLLFTSFTYIFMSTYGFNEGEAGLAYLGVGVGFILGLLCTGFYSDKYLKQVRSTRPAVPEDHLPPTVVGAVLVPVGLFIYGWTAQYAVHWIVPIVGTGIFGFGVLLGFMPVQVYLVETYTIFAASAIASNTVVRSLLGAVLPLVSQRLYDDLGYGWGNSLLGFIAVAFIPAPVFLLKYGAAIRSNPKFQVRL